MLERIEIGTTPVMEECVQVSDKFDYIKPMRWEALMYKHQLKEMFSKEISANLYFSLKSFVHDFGRYYEVTIVCENEASLDLAYDIEENLPEYWDVGYDLIVYLDNFAKGDMEDVIRKKFDDVNKQVHYIRIYTKETHLDAWLDIDLYNEVIDKCITDKDVKGLTEILDIIEKGAYYIKRDMQYDEPSTRECAPGVDRFKGAIYKLASEAADMDEDDVESYVKTYTQMVQKALDSYNGDFDELRICWHCGLPLTYKSMAWDEGFHFDSCL